MSKPKYPTTRKDGKPFAKTLSGWRLCRLDDGTPAYIWVGVKEETEKED